MTKTVLLTNGPEKKIMIREGSKTTFKDESHIHRMMWIAESDAFKCDCGELITREAVRTMREIIDIEDRSRLD